MLTKRLIGGLFVLAAGAAPAQAMAGYFGLAFGQATLKDWDSSVIDDGSFSSIDAEDSDTSFRILGGLDLSPNLALELGYSDLGEATAKGTSDGSVFWAAGPVSAKSSADGIDIGLLAKAPLSESLGVYGRLGLLMWNGEGTFSDSSGSLSASDDGNDLFFGIGGEFSTTGALAFRGEYTKYSLDDVDIDSLSFSLIYRVGP